MSDSDDLLGSFVTIRIPPEAVPDDCTLVDGEVTGIGGVLVQVTAGGRVYYRHRNDL